MKAGKNDNKSVIIQTIEDCESAKLLQC